MKIYGQNTVISEYPPKDTKSLWVDKGQLKMFINGKWQNVGNGDSQNEDSNNEGAEIEFFIDSSSGWVLPMGTTSFKAKEGMTWLEWVNSEYNTYGLFAEEEASTVDIVNVQGDSWNWGYESISGVHPEDEITPNHTYTTVYEGAPGFQP